MTDTTRLCLLIAIFGFVGGFFGYRDLDYKTPEFWVVALALLATEIISRA